MNCQFAIADLRLKGGSDAGRLIARSIANRKSKIGNGFTLTEVLIVIGIIILVIALAVPALSLISGSRSIDGAENNVSAMIGRARADALGLQSPHGVMFFIDPATQGVMMAEVQAVTEPQLTGAGLDRQVYLELVDNRDFMALPKGVGAQVIDNADVTGTVRADDGYIGYDSYAGTSPFLYGGVIMFDGSGRLYNPTYGFDFQTNAVAPTRMAVLFTAPAAATHHHPLPAAPSAISGFGLVLFDREAFANNGDEADGPYGIPEQGEESWIDDNSVPLLINRYNGTLVRGE